MILAVMLGVATVVSAGDAPQNTGNDILRNCRPFFANLSGEERKALTDIDRVHMGRCAGYLDAAIYVEKVWKNTEGASSKADHFCIPAEVENGQILLILKKWMDEHPEELHKEFAAIIHRVLVKTFPCKSQKFK